MIKGKVLLLQQDVRQGQGEQHFDIGNQATNDSQTLRSVTASPNCALFFVLFSFQSGSKMTSPMTSHR